MTMPTTETPTTEELQAAFCWEPDDQIPRGPAMTAFRREARYRQALWRQAHEHPIGSQPIVAKPGDTRVRPVGSRLPLDYAQRTGANFLTPSAWDAARARTTHAEAHQSFDHQRLWADLLSSQALAFNLFGELAADVTHADRAVHQWCDTPGRVRELRFAHSPGRLDPAYLNSLRAFTAAFILDLDDGTSGVLAVEVKYHERNKAETPRPDNLHRYTAVAERSGAFAPGSIATLVRRSDLCVMWLEHLLALSMVQHPSRSWTWGKYLVVHPAGNGDIVDACARYRAMLADPSTFATMTIEQLLDTGSLSETTTAAVHERYVP